MKYVGLGMIGVAIIIDTFSALRRKKFDEYQIITLEKIMLFNGSFMKIKQIQLGYSLPALVTNKLHIGHTRIYASLDDFFTFTNYPGMDPEASSSDNNSIGIDRGFFPISKKVLFGLSLNF